MNERTTTKIMLPSIAPSTCGKFDEKYFWCAVGDIADNKILTTKLLFAKYIYLDDEADCVLIIGVIPHKRFSIGARIEMNKSKRVLYLDKATLLDLVECIDEIFSENAVYPKSCRSVRIQTVDENVCRICICTGVVVAAVPAAVDSNAYEQTVKIPIDALLTMRAKNGIIKMIVNMFECNNKNNEYESQLHKLLLHFCYDGDERAVVNAMQAPTLLSKRQFNDIMCSINCHCVDTGFTVGVINDCADWFLACVPLFIRTLMLNSN